MTSSITRVHKSREMPFRIVGTGSSSYGLVRDNNEDAILLDLNGTLWAVADGMGGMSKGDLAAEIIVDTLADMSLSGAVIDDIMRALASANSQIREIKATRDLDGIGATVVALALHGNCGTLVWSGDSRAYLFRHGYLRQMTRDHSVVQDLVNQGVLDAQTAGRHPDAHIVTKAIGAADALDSEALEFRLQAGDRILLCSDGLTDVVPNVAIAAKLAHESTPQAAVDALIATAYEEGAPDNVSAVVVDLVPIKPCG